MADVHDNVDKSGLIPFKPGESGNPNGRPRKMVSQVIKDLGDAGIEHVTKQQVVGAIETLMNCTEEDLQKYSEDKSHAILIRMVAKHILNSGDDDKVLTMLLDRAFGKPQNAMDVTTKGESINDIDYSELSDEALKEIANAQSKSDKG